MVVELLDRPKLVQSTKPALGLSCRQVVRGFPQCRNLLPENSVQCRLLYQSASFQDRGVLGGLDTVRLASAGGEKQPAVVLQRQADQRVHLFYREKPGLIHPKNLAPRPTVQVFVLHQLLKRLRTRKTFAFQHLDRGRGGGEHMDLLSRALFEGGHGLDHHGGFTGPGSAADRCHQVAGPENVLDRQGLLLARSHPRIQDFPTLRSAQRLEPRTAARDPLQELPFLGEDSDGRESVPSPDEYRIRASKRLRLLYRSDSNGSSQQHPARPPGTTHPDPFEQMPNRQRVRCVDGQESVRKPRSDRLAAQGGPLFCGHLCAPHPHPLVRIQHFRALLFARQGAKFAFDLRERVGKIHAGLLHERPSLRFQNRVLFAGQPFNVVGSTREFLDQLPRNGSELKGALGSPDPVSRLYQLFRQSSIEGCLIERRVPLDIAELPRFPALLKFIKARVKYKRVNWIVPAGNSSHSPIYPM